MTKPHFEKAPQILINGTEKAPVSLSGGPFPARGSLCLVGQKKQRLGSHTESCGPAVSLTSWITYSESPHLSEPQSPPW